MLWQRVAGFSLCLGSLVYCEDMGQQISSVFVVVSIVVPVALFFIAPLILRRSGASSQDIRRASPWLIGALLLFGVAWYIPSPLVDGMATSWWTHFLGGGVFTALLWQYIRRSLRLAISPWLELCVVFGLVSALGVSNELFELTVVKFGFVAMTLDDTAWDLAANSAGALIGHGVIVLLICARYRCTVK